VVTAEPDRWYFMDRSMGLLHSFEQTMIGNTFQISEEIPKLVWNLSENEKIIGGFSCKQAFTSFRGREYEAWYAPSLPFPNGPWKLNGLPGLILEAYDEGEFVKWNFKSYKFQVNVKQNYTIRKDKNSKKAIKFLNLNDFKQYCINKIESDYDRLIVIAKEHPGMTPVKEPITSYYLESFE
jgi:GLPGLI family protein